LPSVLWQGRRQAPNPPPKRDRADLDNGPKKLGKLPMPSFIDRAVALGKIEEGRLAINASRNEVAFNLCYAAAGNPQVRGLALACMGERRVRARSLRRSDQVGQAGLKNRATSQEVYLLLGKAYYKQKNCKEARIYYTKVLNGPDSDESRGPARDGAVQRVAQPGPFPEPELQTPSIHKILRRP
jgi:hypothetical protein